MIDLTPLDVRKKKEDFKKAVRGYDSGQVEAFLDVVADRLEQLVTEQRQLRERVERLEEELSHYKERERALNEALLAAQELREEARSQAERDAAVRLREAETHAEAILLEADQAIRHSQRRLKEVRAHRVQLLRGLRGMIERFNETLELEESRLDEEPKVMEDLLEKLERDAPRIGGSRPGEAAEEGKGHAGTEGEAGRPAPPAEGEPAPGGQVSAEEPR